MSVWDFAKEVLRATWPLAVIGLIGAALVIRDLFNLIRKGDRYAVQEKRR